MTETTAQIVLRSKNYWMDRALAAERNVERALRALQGDHDVPAAIDHLEDALRPFDD